MSPLAANAAVQCSMMNGVASNLKQFRMDAAAGKAALSAAGAKDSAAAVQALIDAMQAVGDVVIEKSDALNEANQLQP